MIAVERPAPESDDPELALVPAEPAPPPAAAEGGFGVLDTTVAFGLQGRAAALHQHWAAMRLDGIPDSDLATLEREWAFSQSTTLLGVGAVFWSPRAGSTIDRWQAESDEIWERD